MTYWISIHFHYAELYLNEVPQLSRLHLELPKIFELFHWVLVYLVFCSEFDALKPLHFDNFFLFLVGEFFTALVECHLIYVVLFLDYVSKKAEFFWSELFRG